MYISPIRSDGAESQCHAELWYAWMQDSPGGDPSAGSVVVTVATKGWKAQKFGQAMWYKPAKSGIYASQLFVGEACQGSCSAIAKNIKLQGAKQVKMHSGIFQDVKLVKNEATATGHAFHITMTSKKRPAQAGSGSSHWNTATTARTHKRRIRTSIRTFTLTLRNSSRRCLLWQTQKQKKINPSHLAIPKAPVAERVTKKANMTKIRTTINS